MADIVRPPIALVRSILEEVYGTSDDVTELAYDVVDWWGGWARRAADPEIEAPSVHDELYLYIWNRFTESDGASIAADKIMEAVEKKS